MPRIAIFLAVLGLPLSAASQPEMPPDVRAARVGDTDVVLTTEWGKGASLTIGKGKAEPAYKGTAAGTVAAGHDIGLVALATADDKPFVVRAIKSGKLGKATAVARPGKRRDDPFAVAATATPDGFTVFFQEIESENANMAHMYMLLLDKTGSPTGAATEIAAPWSLGAAVWNGAGYHLALFYPGDQNGMRLSMVSLSAAGVPEQHPDWASAAGYIAEVHLHRDGDGKRIRAFYRGGGSGETIMESDVTQIRSWGSEPPKAKSHGRIGRGKSLIVTAEGKALTI